MAVTFSGMNKRCRLFIGINWNPVDPHSKRERNDKPTENNRKIMSDKKTDGQEMD